MAKEVELSTTIFHDPEWISSFGNRVHSNNVLFYFRQSPFYDRLSSNETVFAQSIGNPEREQMYLGTRARYENELQHHIGVQFTVEFDPLESKARIRGPNGIAEESENWIIKKARRENLQQSQKDLTALNYYYIVNNIIYQAPRLDSILSYHMTNVTMSLDKMMKAITSLPKFSPSTGYPYLKESQKPKARPGTAGQQSKAGTPMPEVLGMSSQDPSSQESQAVANDRTLRESLALTMAYASQYYDDAPLVGEPGSFRYTKTKDPISNLRAAEDGIKSQPHSKAGTPVPSQPTKATASIQSTQEAKAAPAEVEQTKSKPKRKKSVIVNGTS